MKAKDTVTNLWNVFLVYRDVCRTEEMSLQLWTCKCTRRFKNWDMNKRKWFEFSKIISSMNDKSFVSKINNLMKYNKLSIVLWLKLNISFKFLLPGEIDTFKSCILNLLVRIV